MNRARINHARRREARPSLSPRIRLWQKIEAARNATKAVQKHGEHHGTEDGAKYRFARAEDAFIEAKRVFAEQRLIVLPGIPSTKQKWGQVGLVLEVEMSFEVIDVETGESVTLPWVGFGHDKPGDKAIGKGITGAKKYFLASLLEIPFVGIDAEADEPPADTASSREANRIREKQDREAERPDLQPVPDESDLPAPDEEGLAHG